MDKVVSSTREAVADMQDGATVAVTGFSVSHRFPDGLLAAVREKGVKNLRIIGNSLGTGGQHSSQLVENHQVSRIVVSFSARPGGTSAAEIQIGSGEIQVELVPQGVLVERLRAAGAGLAGFYSPVGVGTLLADGKEERVFDGKRFVFESALHADYALLRAYRGDHMGNLQFRGGSQNFNPSFAKAARIAIAEVDEIVENGAIPPELVDLPGIFVSRVVKSPQVVKFEDVRGVGLNRRAADVPRSYNGKVALTRAQIAERAARLLPEGGYVNIGTGIPALASSYIGDRDITLHTENGMLGFGGIVTGEGADPDFYSAGLQYVSLKPGASFFDSVTSFEIARGGWLSAVVLGAYQVDQEGNLANWSTAGMIGGGIGGAMDLVSGGTPVVVVMEHTDSHKNSPKLVKRCTFPVTGLNCVESVVTDLALLRRRDGRFVLEEVAPGFTPAEVLALTDMDVVVPAKVGVIMR